MGGHGGFFDVVELKLVVVAVEAFERGLLLKHRQQQRSVFFGNICVGVVLQVEEEFDGHLRSKGHFGLR